MNRVLHFTSLWLPVLAYGTLVFYLSSLPVVPVAGRLPDYLTHPAEYLVLTLLVVRALHGGGVTPIRRGTCLGAIALTVAYAISDEIHQLHVPRRTASLKDVLSDTLGAVLALGVAEVFQRIRSRRLGLPVSVTLYTRAECRHCHQARAILRRIAREVPLQLSEVDVDSDPTLSSRYGAQVPVILVGDTKISKLIPDEETIRRGLTRRVFRSSG